MGRAMIGWRQGRGAAVTVAALTAAGACAVLLAWRIQRASEFRRERDAQRDGRIAVLRARADAQDSRINCVMDMLGRICADAGLAEEIARPPLRGMRGGRAG